MIAWLLGMIDIFGAVAFGVSVILLFVGLLLRYGKREEGFWSHATDMLRQLEVKENQDKIGFMVNLNDKNVFVTNFPIQIKQMYFRLEERYQLLSKEYDRLKEAYNYVQVAAVASLVAFLIFRLLHFKP